MVYKILIAEDESRLLEAVALNLEMEGYEVEAVETGSKALQKAMDDFFHLIILDVMLPDMDGFAICQKIREKNSDTPILFLTALGAGEDKIKGLKMGGDDYMTKPFNLDEFLMRVKVLLKHSAKSLVKPELVTYSFGGNEINFATFSAQSHSGAKLKLTKKEIDLLRLLINRKGEAVSRDKILRMVWGVDDYDNMRTVDNFISRFRKYFEKNPKSPVHFTSERSKGYMFIETPALNGK